MHVECFYESGCDLEWHLILMRQLHERNEKGPIDILDTMNSFLLVDIEPMKVRQASSDQVDNDWLKLVASK